LSSVIDSGSISAVKPQSLPGVVIFKCIPDAVFVGSETVLVCILALV
jgi:hypothetical protein